jgi:hypothetical protein
MITHEEEGSEHSIDETFAEAAPLRVKNKRKKESA